MTSAASTVSTLRSFPGKDSIPPACFYTRQGLEGWLNNNPIYKIPFSYTGISPYLIPPSLVPSSLSAGGYSQKKVPLCSNVTNLSQHLSLVYNQQLSLFQKIYTINSNAYISSIFTGAPPIYYTFSSFNEKYQYNSAVGLVNKLYNFNAMANAPGVNWHIPFPIAS